MRNFTRYVVICLFILLAQSAVAQKYKKLHFKTIVADTHNDILTQCLDDSLSFDQDLRGKAQSDIARFKQGGLNVQVFSVWCDGLQQHPFTYANRQIDTLYATALRNPASLMIVKNVRDLKRAVHDKKLAAMMGVEGGHMIEDDLNKLDSFFSRGVRYMTLTWNNSATWATSAKEETTDSLLKQPKGLNDFGRKVVHRMNELGMLVDLSHVGEKTFWDAISMVSKPVLVSHSCVYKLCPVYRNLKDDQIRAVGKNGGLIGLNFYSGFLDSNYARHNAAFLLRHKAERDSLLKENPQEHFASMFLYNKYKNEVEDMRASFSLLFDHLDYIVKMIGVDHVGLGADFDGCESTPKQLDDVTSYPLVTQELLTRGYSKKDIKKILGENFLRVLKANEANTKL